MAQKEELMITGKKMIIALIAVVLVLCAGIYFALTYTKDKGESEKGGESNIVTAFEKDVSLLESVEITNENGTFTLEKSGDEYIANGDKGIEISKTRVSFLFNEICSVTAEKEVEKNAEDLAKYSLDTPKCSAVAHFSDGDVTFKTGGQTSAGSYFFSIDNDVYIVSTSKGEVFANPLSYYRNTKILNVDTEKLTHIAFSGDNDTVTLVKNGEEWKITSPVNADAYLGSVSENILAKAGNISIVDFVEDNAQDIEKYGFSSGKYVYFEDSDGKKQKIFVGAKNGENYYIMTENSKNVYTAPYDSLSYINLKAVNFTDGFVCLTNIKDITGLDITDDKNGKTYKLTIERNGDNETYKKDGVEVTSEKFKDMYQKIIAVKADDFAFGRNGNEKVCEIVYHMNDGSDLRVEFFALESRRLLARVSGKGEYIAVSDDVDAALAAVKQ